MITEDTQHDVLLHAAELLKEQEALKVQMRINEAELTTIARKYGEAYRIWGFRPAEVLRQACVARGIL
jgi:phage tail sheath protein FI